MVTIFPACTCHIRYQASTRGSPIQCDLFHPSKYSRISLSHHVLTRCQISGPNCPRRRYFDEESICQNNERGRRHVSSYCRYTEIVWRANFLFRATKNHSRCPSHRPPSAAVRWIIHLFARRTPPTKKSLVGRWASNVGDKTRFITLRRRFVANTWGSNGFLKAWSMGLLT